MSNPRKINFNNGSKDGSNSSNQYNTRNGNQGRFQQRGTRLVFRGGPARSGAANNVNEQLSASGWLDKIARDRKFVRFNAMQAFKRAGVFCFKHWEAGMNGMFKYMTQDFFDTCVRIVQHYQETVGEMAPSEEDEDLETMRARAFSL